MAKKYLYIVVFLALLILFYPILSLSDVEYRTATYMKKQDYTKKVEVTGTIVSPNNAEICFSYPVYIDNCYVQENSYVNKGQLIFTLDTEKMKNVVKDYSFTQYTDAFSTLDYNDLAQLNSEIYATDSGFVRNLCAYSGNIVLPNENLCVIETDSKLILKIPLSQEDYSKINVGDDIEFSTVIKPDIKYYGNISRKTAVLRKETSVTGSRTVIDIYADIQIPDKNLIQGLQFSGSVTDGYTKTMNVLPYEYINQDEKGEYVNVFENGKSNKVYIETGYETADNVEILSEFDESTIFLKNPCDSNKAVLLNYEI